MKAFRTLGISLIAMLICSGIAISQETFTAGTWTAVTAPAPSDVAHMVLLTDGSVLVNSFFFSNHSDPWYRLVPDNTGSYINGTWKNAGALPTGYNPLYFASAVLPSGRVIIMGGEYNNGTAVWTTKGAFYNPLANTWSSVSAPTGWTTIGDASGIVLPSGKFMLANCCTKQQALLTSVNPVTWTSTGTGKSDENDEEGWTLLPNGNVLTVDAYVNSSCCKKGSEIYNTATGTWSAGPGTVVNLVDPGSSEIGPAVLRPDGTVFYGGGTTSNAIYDSTINTFSAAPSFGGGLTMADAPAALLPNGNVLLETSPGVFQNGLKFFEWDGTNLNSAPVPPNSNNFTSFEGNMVCLPNGQILFTEFSTTSPSQVEIYTPSGTFNPAWQPVITNLASTFTHGSKNNVVGGTQFNGLSQCSYYGDDNQSATNFPLVRITNGSTGHVMYARTHNFSNMGVATGSTLVKAQFDIPASIELGVSTLEVVANGIPSAPVTVTIN
jgi:hypothetical protein